MPAILAVGAHLKNTVALAHGSAVFLSQHVGDLQTATAYSAFRRATSDLPRLYDAKPVTAACDLHPDYLSTKFARSLGLPLVHVQHHYAHVLACMADNELAPPVLGVAWDGTGLGSNGSIWGGEFLRIDEATFQRTAHLLPFRLPGGDIAMREPRRSALGALYEMFRDDLFDRRSDWPVRDFDDTDLPLLRKMLARGLNSPLTSSVGRLFDAVASITGLCQRAAFEGQAAMDLEFAVAPGISDTYRFEIEEGEPIVLDWRPTLKAVLDDVRVGVPTSLISARFHNTLALMTVAVAELAGETRVVLTGGCFQNRYLTTQCVHLLESAGFKAAWHQRVPPNDGGIALGQAVAAARNRLTPAPIGKIVAQLVA